MSACFIAQPRSDGYIQDLLLQSSYGLKSEEAYELEGWVKRVDYIQKTLLKPH